MRRPNDQTDGSDPRPDPQRSQVDPGAVAIQEKVKADRDALENSARRVQASVSTELQDRTAPIAGNAGGGEVITASPQRAAVDPVAAAQQNQVKADHAALQESARRVESSVAPDVRGATPSRPSVDPVAAAQQDQVKADHDALKESARRVESSVSSSVRDTPIQSSTRGIQATQDSTEAQRHADNARENADQARESARRATKDNG